MNFTDELNTLLNLLATLASYIPYMWNYWQVEYLVICSKNAVGNIFILQF